MTFKEAVLTRNGPVCCRCVDHFRLQRGMKYREILDLAKHVDPSLTDAEWDTLMDEEDASCP